MPQGQTRIHTTASLSTGLRDHLNTSTQSSSTQIPPRQVSSSPGLIESTPLSTNVLPTVEPAHRPDSPSQVPSPRSIWSYHPAQPTLSQTLLPTNSPLRIDNDPERQITQDTANEKHAEPASTSCNPYRIWPPWKRDDGWAGWRDEWVRKDALVIPLIIQAFSAGVLDATTYADFQTFASNQTGNTILLCVSVVGTVKVIIKLTAISLGAFLSAAFIFGHLGHYFGVRQRGWIIFTTAWQIISLILAAILVSPSGPSIFQIGGQHEWFILLLFAQMSGAQVAQARQSSNTELPTAPMTSSYVDLMSDKYLFVGFRHKKAGPRNRKLAYTSCMIGGGLLGAVIHRWAGSWEVVVVTLLLKCLMLVMVCCAKVDDCPRLE